MAENNRITSNRPLVYDEEADPLCQSDAPGTDTERGPRPAFVPNPEELEQLVRFWAEEELEFRLTFFNYAQYGGGRWHAFAARRLWELREVLGDEAVDRVVAGVTEETRREMGPEKWRIFTRGSEEERARIVEENYRRFDYLEGKQQDVATCEKAFAYLRANPCGYFLDADGDLWSLAEFPHVAKNCADRRLLLRVTTRSGGVAYVPAYAMDLPAVWYPPFGLR